MYPLILILSAHAVILEMVESESSFQLTKTNCRVSRSFNLYYMHVAQTSIDHVVKRQ